MPYLGAAHIQKLKENDNKNHLIFCGWRLYERGQSLEDLQATLKIMSNSVNRDFYRFLDQERPNYSKL